MRILEILLFIIAASPALAGPTTHCLHQAGCAAACYKYPRAAGKVSESGNPANGCYQPFCIADLTL